MKQQSVGRYVTRSHYLSSLRRAR